MTLILMRMRSLSLIVITKDAEAHIARCLDSVPFAIDKVVLDSGSTDRTCEIAKQYDARVFQETWRGFGPQKVRAGELAQNDWLLSLDADEVLSEAAAQEISLWLNASDDTAEAYALPRLSRHMGRWIRHGGWYPDWQTRLYNKTKVNWSTDVIHERVQARNPKHLKEPILHYVFTDLHDQVATNNRYSGLGTTGLIAKGQRFYTFNLITKPWVKFFEVYVWKRGFLDGMPGFIIGVGAAYSVFLKWAKLWEHEQNTR